MLWLRYGFSFDPASGAFCLCYREKLGITFSIVCVPQIKGPAEDPRPWLFAQQGLSRGAHRKIDRGGLQLLAVPSSSGKATASGIEDVLAVALPLLAARPELQPSAADLPVGAAA